MKLKPVNYHFHRISLDYRLPLFYQDFAIKNRLRQISVPHLFYDFDLIRVKFPAQFDVLENLLKG